MIADGAKAGMLVAAAAVSASVLAFFIAHQRRKKDNFKPKRIILVRHGESEANATMVFTSSYGILLLEAEA